jgi:type II secretory pathway predicted ATPase ExeA
VRGAPLPSKNDFVLDWDRALGFKGDPFADKIMEPVSDFLVDRVEEKEKLNWFFIKSYFYGTIIGEHGVGKTMLLKWLEDRLRRYNRLHAVYINAAVFKEQINIPHQMLFPLLSVYEKMISKPHKKLMDFDYHSFLKKKLGQKSVVLLIDNAQNLTEKNLELIKSMREEGLRVQIIVTSTPSEFEKSRLQELGHDELHIILRRLTYDESKEMIMRRVKALGGSGIVPFNEENLTVLYERADKNPRQFLHLCRDEAIRLLIHRKDYLERQAMQPRREAKNIKTTPARPGIGARDMDIKIRKAERNEIEEERQEEKKKFINIKFDFGKKKTDSGRMPERALERTADKTPDRMPETRQKAQPNAREEPARHDDRRAIYNEKHKQELVDRLRSSSPRRNPVATPVSREKKQHHDEPLSEADRILRELSEEFEKK